VPVGLGFPTDAWSRALESGVRQLWITVPNNPTGAWVSPEELLPLLVQAAALADPPLVVIDEAYAEFAPRTHRLAVDAFENVLLLRTFSKALASAGWRLGYLIGNPAVIRKLAGLQLPYSMPLPALEALDVALDFSAEFDAEIRRTMERRDRLAECLGVPAGAGNFLLVSPDPAPRLKAAGLLCRTFPGEDRARLSIGTEGEIATAARALGRELPPAKPVAKRRLLVLDVDGVLIEPGRSFMDAVARALGELLPGLEWSDGHFQAFKRAGGFNNDFRLTAGAVALAERGEMARLWSSEGKGLPELRARLDELEPQCKEVVQRHYADTRWQERALATLAELKATGMDLAVLTGRPPEEWALAIGTLGFELPAITDSAEHLRKPRPEGLLQLADAFRAQEIVFVGDTRDDAGCLAAAREIRPEIRWTFAAVGPDRARISCEGDLVVPTLRDLLPLLKEERP
jgi:phosphoglycolate phosphatase-like HAD superfamily hydrolase